LLFDFESKCNPNPKHKSSSDPASFLIYIAKPSPKLIFPHKAPLSRFAFAFDRFLSWIFYWPNSTLSDGDKDAFFAFRTAITKNRKVLLISL